MKSTIDDKEITAGLKEIFTIFGQLYQFEITAFSSENEFVDIMFAEQKIKIMAIPKQTDLKIEIPGQDQIKSIKL